MEKQINFWQDLVSYLSRRASPTLPWIGIALVATIAIVSWFTRETSMVGVKTWKEAVARAATVGDYQTARQLYQEPPTQESNVLGADLDLENLVYPERKIEREIARLTSLKAKYPGSRDILVQLSRLNEELGKDELAQEYWEQARTLDPNNEMFD